MGAIREVRKRDGRVVPFDEMKIADAIYKAIRSVGKGTRSLSEELAAAVTHFLEQRFSGAIPGIEDIQDQVETVLIETGHAEIAKAYILYRNKRAAMREVLQVRKTPPEEAFEESRGGPEVVEDRVGVSSWCKSKIAAALIREADMDAETAEEIASAVERKVFSSELKRISTALIRELVDNELFERGFSAKLARQAPIGLPKYNLEQILFGTDTKEGYTFPKTPVEVRDFIASQILQQYALEEIVSRPVSDAHRDGRIHLHRLGDPIRLSRLTLDLGRSCLPDATGAGSASLRRGEIGAPGRLDPAEFFRDLDRLASFVAEEIRLRRPGMLLADGGRSGPRSLDAVEAVYRRLREVQKGFQGAAVALELDLDSEAVPWLRALSERPLLRGPAIYLRLLEEGFSDPALRSALRTAAALFGRGEPIEFVPPRASRRSPSRPGALGTSPAITVNLPRMAFRSASDRLGLIERELEEVLEIAIKGHLERRRFLERLGANRENPLWDILGHPRGKDADPLVEIGDVEFPIGVLGLNECIKFLTGSDLHQDPRAQKMGLSIVETMARKVRRDAHGLGLRLILLETRNTGSVRRLEEIDRRRYPAESGEIHRGRGPFAGRSASPEGAQYTDGVRIHRLAPVDPLKRIGHLGVFMPYVETIGVVEDSPELRSGGEDLILSLLEDSLPYLVGRGSPEASDPENDPSASPRRAREETQMDIEVK